MYRVASASLPRLTAKGNGMLKPVTVTNSKALLRLITIFNVPPLCIRQYGYGSRVSSVNPFWITGKNDGIVTPKLTVAVQMPPLQTRSAILEAFPMVWV